MRRGKIAVLENEVFFFKHEKEKEKYNQENMETISTRKKCRRLHLREMEVVYV